MSGKRRTKKGFVVSIDAILALFVVFTFLISLFGTLKSIPPLPLSMQRTGMDVMTVIERTGAFSLPAT